MQGRRISLTTLPENSSLDHGSTSSEPVIDSQISWNNIPNSAHNRLPDYIIPSNEGLNVGWSLGETSSHNRGDDNDSKTEHAWTILSRPPLVLDGTRHKSPVIVSSDINNNVDLNANISPTANSYISVTEGSEHGPARNLDGRRKSRKRKSLDFHVGQSSHAERSNVGTMSMLTETGPPANSGLTPLPAAETSRRNLRLRINGSRQQDHHHVTGDTFLPGPEPVIADNQNSSSFVFRNHLIDLNPPPAVENGSVLGQSGLLHVPFVRSDAQSVWGGSISSRASSSYRSIDTDPMIRDESMSRNVSRSVSAHPMFGDLSQQHTNWNMAGNNNNNNIVGNVAFTPCVGPASGMNSYGPSWANRSRPQYPRRVPEIVRRSLLSTEAGVESFGSESSGRAVRFGSSGSGNLGRHLLSTRSALLERQHVVGGGFGLPHPLRSSGGGGGGGGGDGEGRTSTMSEIRHVLDLMRRGEGLRIEDMMILDHSVLFGMTDIQDRHRDMRLDVDNMSYEELLALEERIGNVCTGLKEETIVCRLKQKKHVNGGGQNQAETEPCSICREEYDDGDDIGTLECGHDFHRECVKQWLMNKNLCPICKTTGLTT